MEELPAVSEPERMPVHIPVRPDLLDHRFEEGAVYPAVEALETLAALVKRWRPDTDVTRMADARFDKFIPLSEDVSCIEAFAELATRENGDVTATLMTRARFGKAAMTRLKAHVTVSFPRRGDTPSGPPLDLAAAVEGIALLVSPDRIYRELVPFGPAYRNIRGPLVLSVDGALAEIRLPEGNSQDETSGVLGSPFVLDAAFHAACVWGQRFGGIVAFPIGIDRRTVLIPTRPGETYTSRVVPVRREVDLLVFDLWIYDSEGALCEAAVGVRMRDVSSGRMRPPPWISERAERAAPDRIAAGCTAVSVVELASVARLAEGALSDGERRRFDKMGERRRRSFLAARMACKRVSRRLSGEDWRTEARAISTVSLEGPKPRCPVTEGHPPLSCSVSHDDRFAVAAAAGGRIGVDVEKITNRVVRARRLFATEAEECLTRSSPLGEAAATLRIWSVKEAVAKALDIGLAEAWHRVEVTGVEEHQSLVRIDSRDGTRAVHETVDGHLFTLFEQP